MISQIHMAKSGAYVCQKMLIVTSDNIANSLTTGYKAKEVYTENMFPLVLSRSLSEFEEENVPVGQKRKRYFEFGQGVRISSITKDMSQGTIEVTNRSLDVAIRGKGYLQFRLPDGSVKYSRAGNLFMDRDGNVVNANGHSLEPAIRIPKEQIEIILNPEGKVFVQIANQAQPQEVGQIMLATFSNEEGLFDVGQNMYNETASSGPPVLENPGQNVSGFMQQRALEFSNVNVVNELMDMLVINRTFDAIIKAIKTADQMLKDGSDIK